jgi:acetolactate synthase-1/2/3 large subunit
MEAMRKGGLQFVLTAHEGSAGFAADVTGRLTGAPGLCIATLGPGATNLATGVGSAYLDRSPMLAITCTLNQAQLGRRIQMWIDHQALFKPITKASLVLRPGRIAETLTAALNLAMSEPRGPVHLDLPEDVALATTGEALPVLAKPTALPGANADSIGEAAGILRRARRPVAVIGANAMRLREPQVLRTFIDRHRMPFATTTMAKGLVDEDHGLSLGCIERARRKVQRQFLQSADLIVGLGYDTIEVEYEAWVGNVPVLHIDIEPADVDPSVKLAYQLVGDLDSSITALGTIAPAENVWPATAVDEHRRVFQKALRPATNALSPHQAIDVVRRALPAHGVLAFDVGAHTHQIASQWTAHAPGTFLITNGWSSMGFGLPAAIAAKLARPDLPVVCVLGDGCFQMTCGEVAVAQREGLSIPFVVLNDGWLSLIKVKQERRDLALYGTELPQPNFQDPPAHYFGVRAVGVRNAVQLEQALSQALTAHGPTVIEALVDAEHYSETVFD